MKSSGNHHSVPASKKDTIKETFEKVYCEEHLDYRLELICNECNVSICWKCKSLKHLLHECVEIDERADQCIEQLGVDIEEIENRILVLQKLSLNFKDKDMQHQENLEKLKQTITKISADLIRSIVSNEEKLMRQIITFKEKTLQAFQPQRERIDEQLQLLKQHTIEMKQLRDSEKPLQILRSFNKFHEITAEFLSLNIIDIGRPENEIPQLSLTDAEIKESLIRTENFCRGSLLQRPSLVRTEAFRYKNRSCQDLFNNFSDEVFLNLETKGTTLPTESIGRPESYLVKSNSLRYPKSLNKSSDERIMSKKVSLLRHTGLLHAMHLTPSIVSSDEASSSTPERQDQESEDGAQSSHEESLLPEFAQLGNITVDNSKAVCGVTMLNKEIYVIRERTPEILVYNFIGFTLRTRQTIDGLIQPNDLTSCNFHNCVYVVDWKSSKLHRIRLVDGTKNVLKWDLGNDFGGISRSYDSNVIVTCYKACSLKEYSTEGKLLAKIALQPNSGDVIHPWHALKHISGDYLVCYGDGLKGTHSVCLVNTRGQILKSFGGKKDSGSSGLFSPYHLSMDSNGNVLVADCNNSRIVILNQNLEYLGNFNSELRRPRRICFDPVSNIILVADNEMNGSISADGRILTFKVSFTI